MSTKINPLSFCHSSNIDILTEIGKLKDENGKNLLKPIHIEIIRCIARFPNDKGNFMSIEKIKETLPFEISIRTLRRHLKYLKEEVIVIYEDETGSKRLILPKQKQFRSICRFRKDNGMSEYSYKLKKSITTCSSNEIKNNNISEAKFAPNGGKICPLQEANFASYKESIGLPNTDSNHLPLPLLMDKSKNQVKDDDDEKALGRAKRDQGGALPGHPEGEGFRPRSSENFDLFLSDDFSEPLTKMSKKKPKTKKDRMEEAQKLIKEGHIVNPLGKIDTSGRRLSSKRAKNISESGSVTLPQLWKAFEEIYDTFFGSPGRLSELINPTRENIGYFFDNIKQNFIDSCNYNPSYRDIYDYIIWFMDPYRLTLLLDITKKSELYPKQLSGIMHIRKFYEEILKKRNHNETLFVSDKLKREKEITSFIQESYDSFRKSDNNNPSEIIFLLIQYGIVLYAEYLYDNKGLNSSGCKKHIIEVMSEFIKTSSNPEKSVLLLKKSMEDSDRNLMIQSSVWNDWKVECTDLLELAIERSGIKI